MCVSTEYNANHHIDEVVKSDLCTGCGTCVALCPSNAIELNRNNDGSYEPHIKSENCKSCGSCFRVCPGKGIDYELLNEFVFSQNATDELLGNSLGFYLGRSMDKKILKAAASGGLVSSLLEFALEENIIDGALLVRMNSDNPFEPEIFVARTREEILSAAQSKYLPVPLNSKLKEIMETDGKFAVVGLPCHMHGIRKAEMVSEKLRNKMKLHLGLMCSHTLNIYALEFLFKNSKIKTENVKEMKFREGEWPGRVTIKLYRGKDITIAFPRLSLFFNTYLFTPLRCTQSSDFINDFSDISFGDAHSEKDKSNRRGESLIVTKTSTGEEILQKARSKGKINIIEVDREVVLKAQRVGLFFKKKTIEQRIRILKWLNFEIIQDNPKNFNSGVFGYFMSIVVISAAYLSSKAVFRRILYYFPFSVIEKLHAIGAGLFRKRVDVRGEK